MLLNGVRGELAEWLRSGLQIRLHRFDSGTRLHLLPNVLINWLSSLAALCDNIDQVRQT